MRALVTGPEDADAAILVLHDWFGVTDAMRDALQRLSNLGYRAMALDLYDGESATTHERATELSRSLTPDDVRSKLETGLAALAVEESVGAELEVFFYLRARHGYAQPLYAGGDTLDLVAMEST